MGFRHHSGKTRACGGPTPAIALLVAAILALALEVVVGATLAYASQDDSATMSLDHKVTKGLYYMTDKQTGRILYCKNMNLPQPLQDTVMPTQGLTDDLVYDYLMYHGYAGDASISIGGITGDHDALYLITQFAVYDAIDGTGNYVKTLVRATDETYGHVVDYFPIAWDFYQEAKAFADAGGSGPEKGISISYAGGYTTYEQNGRTYKMYRQNMLTRKTGGQIRILKQSAAPEATTDNPYYSFLGARFHIYSDAACTKKVTEVEAGNDGMATTVELPYGTYWVKEVKGPKGYAVSEEPLETKIVAGLTIVNIAEDPLYARGGALLSKVDAETGTSQATGAGELSEARFSVSYYAGAYDESNLPETPTRTWTLTSDDSGSVVLDKAHLIEGDDLFVDDEGQVVVPFGTLRVEETAAPKGYLIPEGALWVLSVTADLAGKEIPLATAEALREPIIRGDLTFEKREEGTSTPMGNVLFRMTSRATGESHIIMTDANGVYSSASVSHSTGTNSLDAAVDESGHVDMSKVSGPCGTWFYGRNPSDAGETPQVDDTRGALPYDTYDLQELASSATVGHELVSFSVDIDQDGSVASQGVINDVPVSLVTTARETTTQGPYLSLASTGIEDTVHYRGLTAGVSYQLTCTLVDAESGEAIKTRAGLTYTTSTTFEPTSSEGDQVISISVDPLELQDTDVVVFERLTRGNNLIARHEDLTDKAQTLHWPSIGTTLTEDASKSHVAQSQSETKLTDEVTYHGLIAGETYSLVGTLVDRETGGVLRDATGEEVRATTTFVPESSSGTTAVPFALDTTVYGDHVLVAFETLYDTDGHELCSHQVLSDDDQSVTIKRHNLVLPQTGDDSAVTAFGLSSILLASGLLALKPRRSRGQMR